MGVVHCEKSPRRKAAVGMVCRGGVEPWRRRKLSIEAKKKVRFLRTGPPIVPPNSFCRVGALTGGKKPRAFSRSFSKNSKTPPWNAFVPLFRVNVVTPLRAWPYSAEYSLEI